MGKNDRKDKYKDDEMKKYKKGQKDDKKHEDFNRILEKIQVQLQLQEQQQKEF
ncbi:hypothetical protein ACFQ9Y_10755 [Peribacillus simplex]|uniref:hypothetical protein n=1 Tax=Peribacillus simplex TaxID=1478 RepID=UPI0036714FD2